MPIWQANPDVVAELYDLKEKDHIRLTDATVGLSFTDSKPFIRNRFNFGKTILFNKFAKLWQGGNKYDFAITLSSDVWHDILNAEQRLALLDLHLTRCSVQYVPEMAEVNGKLTPVKDEYGRIQYTNEIKTDDEGLPMWRVLPLDMFVISDNIRRYGLWLDDFNEVKNAIDKHKEQ